MSFIQTSDTRKQSLRPHSIQNAASGKKSEIFRDHLTATHQTSGAQTLVWAADPPPHSWKRSSPVSLNRNTWPQLHRLLLLQSDCATCSSDTPLNLNAGLNKRPQKQKADEREEVEFSCSSKVPWMPHICKLWLQSWTETWGGRGGGGGGVTGGGERADSRRSCWGEEKI